MKECPYNHSIIHEHTLQNGILKLMDLHRWMRFTNAYYLTGKIYYNGIGCNNDFFHTPDEFLKILNTLGDENVFVISHKQDMLVDKFKSTIKFDKVKNFSHIVE